MKKLLSTLFLSVSPMVAMASEGASSLPIYDFLLEPLATHFSGPLPILLGTIGLAVAAISMFYGGSGEGTKRFFGILFGVGAALAAPAAIEAITGALIP